MQNLFDGLSKQKPAPQKTSSHGQGETGSANRAQAADWLQSIVPDFLKRYEGAERAHTAESAASVMEDFIDFLREKWDVK